MDPVQDIDVTVRKAIASDMYQVCRLLSNSTLNSRWIGINTRKRMFQHVWGGAEDYFGYVMQDGERIVGFLGLLFTRQPVNGEDEKFCELHSWYVDPAYRKESLKLLLPALSLRKVSLLNYTPTPDVYEISKKFGFADMEKEMLLLYPVPLPGGLLFSRYRLESDSSRLLPLLGERDRQIFTDHLQVECRHYAIVDDRTGEHCYMIVKRMRRRWFEPLGRVLYISNRAMFAACSAHVVWRICLAMRLQCLVLNAVEMQGLRPRFARAMVREVPSLIRSKTLDPAAVKPLYSLPLLVGYKLH